MEYNWYYSSWKESEKQNKKCSWNLAEKLLKKKHKEKKKGRMRKKLLFAYCVKWGEWLII